MSKHTPGPWTIRDYKTKTGGIWIDGGFVRNRACGTIAEVYPLTHQGANVHLISAAPDLLSIAKRWAALDGAWDPTRYANDKIELLDDTRAAISKAEGRS